MPTDDIINDAVETAAGYGGKPTPNAFTGSFLEKWLKPGDVQQRELGQQVALQQMQNKYNSEGERLKRMVNAGINPYTAAQGIAGASSVAPSTGGVSFTPDGITPSDIVGAANAATGGAASLAEAAFKKATQNPTVNSLNAGIEKTLADKGLTNEEIFAWKVDNKYRDVNAQTDLRIKLLNEKNVAKQWEVMHAQYELMTTQLDTELAKQQELIATASAQNNLAGLYDAQKQYTDVLKRKTDYEGQWAQQRINFWKTNGFDIESSSTDAILVQKLENGQYIGDLVKSLSEYYGNIADVQQQAIDKYAYSISWHRKNGENVSDITYGRIGSAYDLCGRIASAGTDLLNGVTSSIDDLLNVKSAKEFRKELRMVLDNAYDQLDKYPDDAPRLNKIIDDIQVALQLSNTELMEWKNKSWK